MKNLLNIYLFVVLFFIGCSSTVKKPQVLSSSDKNKTIVVEKSVISQNTQIKNLPTYAVEHNVESTGVVFGKAEFQGILSKADVKLLFEHAQDSSKKFQLVISDAHGKITTDQTINHGYFYIELPLGDYKISNISIPVGSAQASEDLNLAINVKPAVANYVGTLKIDGTKEKIKLGGVPVIKPGFEFTLEIQDQRQEAIEAFHKKYPDANKNIEINLAKKISG